MFDNESIHVFRDENAVKEKEKVSRTNLPRKVKNFSKAQLQLALRKKKECNAKALQIVEALLEPVTDVDRFLLMLQDINQCHFEDVIQERAISLNCGYPLCPKQLDKIPSQKYAISLASKKVFDITERKNFCSGQCYKASNYIKNQMLTSPLWLRDQEDIPEFRLHSSEPEVKKPATSKLPPTTGGMVVDLAGINTDDLKIVERTYPKEEGCPIREGSEIVFKQDTASLTTSDGSKKEKEEEQNELEVGLSKLSVRDD
ncbi:putative RNA polymerase II subunit B1 CTD phosphatase RPAP2 homolog [Culex pipiens pallens]|uniref:putative RNA polymerase II subunit B1 CTD phosphatase RPAP2 homolog n=1 Tax=Culex pipiens pallens TaxID=42434 RepID=UPI0019540E09|nr:putative RNA polymerase II subunit B1 CTD phosphatase RPAP2 homolog [Culex pipiens pallens]